MSDQYVFELQFKGKADGSDYRENQFVIIDGSSMADFSRLKEDLGMCMPEPFTVQYIDDEDDVISIDTEEEFQEFAKIAKKRSSRGMLMRLILNSNLPLDHGQFMTPPGVREMFQSPNTLGFSDSRSHRRGHRQPSSFRLQEFKEKIKAELKNEILTELKEMGPQASSAATDNSNAEATSENGKESGRMEEEAKEAEYEEDSDGNMFLVYLPEKNSRKTKLMHYQKKLEKKEKLVEAKIDQRLEKLELKRKKLMEKYSHHKMLARKPAMDAKVSLPMIISAIATKESSEMSKRVSATKVFTHVWTIVNDGTVPLNNVELRHTWSSPGLEPEEAAAKVMPLLPGQQCTLAVRFKAPCWSQNSSFISYWHFFRLVDARWQEFGHYISVTGSIKPLKSSGHDFVDSKVSENQNKKPKHEEKKVVTFMEEDWDALNAVAETPKDPQKEEKVLNEETMSNITLKKQMEQLQATLASSEIAAEMAREAARLLAMASATEGNTAPGLAAPKPSEGDKLNDCGLEEAAAGVRQLNLVDSESDTDANMETNEDPDRGFVIVTMTPEQTGEEALGKPVNSLPSDVTKEDDKTVPVTDSTKENAQTPPEPMSFPRLDPTVTYPVFPPPPPRVANPPVFMPQTMIPHNVYNYPVFPPTQNATTHGIVFPPPVNYSQIPTYPPIHPPTFHHTPSVTIPLSTQPPFVPVSQPMAPQQGHHFNPFCSRQTGGKIFWTPVCNRPESSAANSAAPTDKADETEAQAQEMNTAENSAANTRSEEATQPEQPQQQQQQPQQQLQQQQQQQLQQQQQQQLQQQQQQQLQQLQQKVQEQLQQFRQQQPQQSEATPQAEEQNKNPDQVQILPQALVDGAINVAATAYSTAWNALNNLRPKEGEASEFDPVFENNMAMLVEMGFNNLERNARLLKRFNNDISQVIGIICSTGGCHNLDID